ncbi:MAG: hypothetical protein AMXMBFR53_41340 [Gemmatimonadota bacterium]
MGLALLAVMLGAAGAAAQEAYFGAVAEFFALPRSEVAILAEWPLPADEIPVVLFLARRAGISPEALVALRDSGRGWSELAGRYRVDASHFHVPLGDGTDARRLDAAYRQFRGLPPGRWGEVSLRDEDIVSLVNLRVLSQTLRRSPDEILAQAGAGPWADLYARLMGGSRPRPGPR